MTDDTHLSEQIELAQEINACFGIGQVIQGSGVLSRASRLGYTPIVVSQRSDSLLGQIVGNHQERLVLEDFFVPVLPSATCYEQHHRDGTFGHELVIDGICQCTRQDSTFGFVLEYHFFGGIRIRRLRSLRAFQGYSYFARLEVQRKSHSVLGEFPFDAFGRYLLSPVVGIQRSDDYFEAICRILLDFHGDTFRTLLGYIHGCGILPVFG